ncbi:MAG: acetate--CoA ligase family protein [Patescibacteria group bacterium]
MRFISQSGAIASALFDYFISCGLGFSEFITLGNKAVLNENDFLEYFLNNGDTPIGLNLESISDGKKLLEIAQKLVAKSPMFIIKPGKTPAAVKAMQSHTGAIAGEDAVLDAALKQAGIIRCNETEEFFDLTRAFSWETAPKGNKIAIISNAGGPAVITSDAISLSGLELVEIVDVLGDALSLQYKDAIDKVMSSGQIDATIIILTPQVMTEIDQTAQIISEAAKKYDQPILCSFMGSGLIENGEQILNRAKVPSFRFPERAVKCLSLMYQWQSSIPRSAGRNLKFENFIFDNDRIKTILDKKEIDSVDGSELLLAAGITTPATKAVASLEEAKKFVEDCGQPVALKLSAPGLLHKTEVGGVITDIWTEDQLIQAWDKLEQKTKQLDETVRNKVKFQIQKQVGMGTEVIVGLKRDPTFGDILLFGAGGTLTELISDRNLFILPAGSDQIMEFIQKSKVAKILNGFRGSEPLAIDKLCDLILRFAAIFEKNQEIAEMEINPAIVTLNDAVAVDVKVVLIGEKTPAPLSKFKTASVTSHTLLTGQFHYFDIEINDELDIKPGQYISVKVADNRINAYSVAHIETKTKFNLLVDTHPGGVGSKFFESVKTGDKLSLLGPFGMFTYKPDDNKVLLLATGSGISAIRCILEEAIKDKTKKITLYFGLRFDTDVFWDDYFKKLAVENPNFTYKLVLSQSGDMKHITDYLAEDYSNYSAYICGNKKMIEEATQILVAKGCPKERIYTEKFY